jgi:hypothetical protein
LTVDNATTTSVDVTIDPEDGNPEDAVYTIYDVTRQKWIAANGSPRTTAVWQMAAEWGTVTVTGLEPDTEYHFVCRTRNGEGVETVASDLTKARTLAVPNRPLPPIVDHATRSTLAVTINPGDGNGEATDYAIYDVTREVWLDENGSVRSTPQWRTAAEWGTVTVKELESNTEYTFRCRARNEDRIESADGPTATATTLQDSQDGGDDEPNDTGGGTDEKDLGAVGFLRTPTSINPTTVSMQATIVSNPPVPPVEYTFKETSGNAGGSSSGWISNATFVDTGLRPNTQYSYQVKGRDADTPPNESPWSEVVAVRTRAAAPPAPIVNDATTETLSVRVAHGDNPSHTLLAIIVDDRTSQGYLKTDGQTSMTPTWQTQQQWGYATVKALNPGQRYEISCVAQNDDGLLSDRSETTVGYTTPEEVILESVIIQGPENVKEGTTTSYALKGTYSDGTVETVSAGVSWGLSTTRWGVITKSGALIAHDVISDQQIQIYADVQDNSRTLSAQKAVAILDQDGPTKVPVPSGTQQTGDGTGSAAGGMCPTTAMTLFLALVGGILLSRRRLA